MTALRWGLLSTAEISAKLLAGARPSPEADVVAVASRDPGRARDYARRHGITRAHHGYDALLADPGVDAVHVSLPNALHHLWTLRALRAGKHVLCEKPYSRHPEEVEEAFDLAEDRGLVLSEGYMFRYAPQIRRLAALVAGGAIGGLRMIAASFAWPCEDPASVCLDAALDGGGLLDVGGYCVSAARLLAGEPLDVCARAVLGPTGVDVALSGTLSFPGDVLASFDCGLAGPERSALEVVGTRGAIRVADPWHGRQPGLTLTRLDGSVETHAVAPADPYRLELEAFGAAVRGAPGVALGRADALGQARTLQALRRSAEEAAQRAA